MKTKIAGALVLIAIVGVAGMRYLGRDDGRPLFRTLPVTRGDLFVGVTATGTVEPVQTIDVGAQIVGRIKSFGPDPQQPGKTIDYNSRVKEGDVLAQLDDLPHRAELDKAKVNLKLAEAELARTRAKQKQAERDFQRAKNLHGTESEAEYEKAMMEDEVAKAELIAAEARVEQAKIAAQQAEINLGYTVIRAPIDGVVIDRRVNVGQTVVAGMNAPSLFLLAKDLSHMLVSAAVNEADIGDIKVAQHVTFKVDEFHDRSFSGKVSQIRLNASLSQSVVMYPVVVDVDNADGTLKPYGTAKLQFEVARRSEAILVPNQALRWQPIWADVSPSARYGLTRPGRSANRQAESDDAGEDEEPRVNTGSPTVWVVADDGLVRPVPVKLGLSDGMVTEITGGKLQPGDRVVAHVERLGQPDFVASFVSKVTGGNK